jgi:hypothetical protein
MTKKVCCVGVCKDMTWDEAKEFIINKHNSLFWESWVDRVSWRELTDNEKLMTENKKLKEENKKLKEQYQPKGSRIDAEGLHDFMNETIQELKYENEKYKKMFENLPNVMEGKRWSVKHQRWRWDDDGFESESEDESEGEITESEAEEDKYDGDDWHWVYGKNIIEQEEYKEVVLIMAGGGDHWENWTMTPNMNYIVNKDGKHPQHGMFLIQSSCGKYLSFQYEDYECEGDECICEYEDCVVC